MDVWVQGICARHSHLKATDLSATCSWLAQTNPHFLQRSLELADLVADLNMDQASVKAAIIYRLVRSSQFDDKEFIAIAGAEAAAIAQAVAAMAGTSLLELSNSALLEKEHRDQVENVRGMLASLIDDVRVAVVKLAERVLALRYAKNYEHARRERIALEAQNIFAPLAGRLGIWQLKWELEDLSLRYTNEQTYMQIARQLKSKRGDREVQVEHMVDQVRGLLRGHGIDAEVFGRAKHIFSIWRKMQKKGVSLEQVHDVRAVRIVVGTLAECYAALGVIHNTWQHIPNEFDDYVAAPKENGYRSIHTAVVAPDERTLEIQIRTKGMHVDAELGVCAHWSYKDGSTSARDYGAKMDWLRQVMEWHEELAGTETLSTLLRHRVSRERIYVATPRGHVLDMPVGSTVLDFAYRVHTDVGHACRGARVNGIPAPLHQVLESGQQVEVDAGGHGKPHRDWLETDLDYISTDRARAKLTHYFRNLGQQQQIGIGRSLLHSRLKCLGVVMPLQAYAEDLLAWVDCDRIETVYQRLGSGELMLTPVLTQLLKLRQQAEELNFAEASRSGAFPQLFRFRIRGENRQGLLHDLTQQVSDMGLTITETTGRVSNPDGQAIITLDLELHGWAESIKFVSYTVHIEGVLELERLPGGNSGR